MVPNPNQKKSSPEFLILISCIVKEVFESIVSNFANNTRIGYSIGDQDDIAKLQTDFNIIFK